jgi:DNA-binding MarR family transcriptional regulator
VSAAPVQPETKEHPKMRIRELLPKLKGPPAIVLWCIWAHSDGADRCWPGVKTIAKECGISTSTARAAIVTLEDLGLVRRHFRANDTTVYELTVYSSPRVRRLKPDPTGEPAPHRRAGGGSPTGQPVDLHRAAGAKGLSKEGLSKELLPSPPAAPPERGTPASQVEPTGPADPAPASPDASKPAASARKAPLSPSAFALFDYLARIAKRYVPDLDVSTWWPTPPKAHVIVANLLLKAYPVDRLKVAIRWAWEDQFWTGSIPDVMALRGRVGQLIAKSSKTWEAVREMPEVWNDPDR